MSGLRAVGTGGPCRAAAPLPPGHILPWPGPLAAACLPDAGCAAPVRPRSPLRWRGQVVGSVDPLWLGRVAEAGVSLPWTAEERPLLPESKQKREQPSLVIQAEEPDLAHLLQDLAQRLHALGLSGPWRSERVPVWRADGAVWLSVERALVRVLGLCTQAVHLVGRAPDGGFWVQQRSLSKPNDPGLWDTLMGGTVSGSETIEQTLVREAWEEAGLALGALADCRPGGRWLACRPTPDGGGAGYLVEDTHWYSATVPWGMTPCNQDGEVERFECWSPEQVRQALAQGRFTPEAAWVMQQALAQG